MKWMQPFSLVASSRLVGRRGESSQQVDAMLIASVLSAILCYRRVKPTDRFQRAAYFSSMLPEPKTEREAVAGVLAIARNVSVPFGAPYKGFGIYNTEYRTVTDLTNKRYFFELTTSPNVIWADLSQFKLASGSPVMVLHPDNIGLSGDVSGRFKAAKAPF